MPIDTHIVWFIKILISWVMSWKSKKYAFTGYSSRCIATRHGHIWIDTPTYEADMQTINMLLEKSKTGPNMMLSIIKRPLLM